MLQDFFDMYNIFKEIINEKYPDTTILIENRNGFLLSKVQDFKDFSDYISNNNIDLGLIVDFPQLLNAEKARSDKNELIRVLEEINYFKHNVKAFHIWGQNGTFAHIGDLRDYFNNTELETFFYEKIGEIFADEQSDYFFIPEINCGYGVKTKDECLLDIVTKLKNVGFSFRND